MFKRFVTLVLLVSICISTLGNANAAIDLSSIKNNPLYYISVQDDGNAFIGTTIPYSEMTLAHKYSLNDYPSDVFSDIIIIDYFSADPTLAWRIWFNYNAERYLGITSVTITIDGADFTFTGMGGKDKMTSHGSYVTESPNILLGQENLAFWFFLLMKWEGLENKGEILDMSFPLILHGTEDIETEINGYAIADMCLIGETYIGLVGFDGIESGGTTVTMEVPESDTSVE